MTSTAASVAAKSSQESPLEDTSSTTNTPTAATTGNSNAQQTGILAGATVSSDKQAGCAVMPSSSLIYAQQNGPYPLAAPNYVYQTQHAGQLMYYQPGQLYQQQQPHLNGKSLSIYIQILLP